MCERKHFDMAPKSLGGGDTRLETSHNRLASLLSISVHYCLTPERPCFVSAAAASPVASVGECKHFDMAPESLGGGGARLETLHNRLASLLAISAIWRQRDPVSCQQQQHHLYDVISLSGFSPMLSGINAAAGLGVMMGRRAGEGRRRGHKLPS